MSGGWCKREVQGKLAGEGRGGKYRQRERVATGGRLHARDDVKVFWRVPPVMCDRGPGYCRGALGGGGGMLSVPLRLKPSMASTCKGKRQDSGEGCNTMGKPMERTKHLLASAPADRHTGVGSTHEAPARRQGQGLPTYGAPFLLPKACMPGQGPSRAVRPRAGTHLGISCERLVPGQAAQHGRGRCQLLCAVHRGVTCRHGGRHQGGQLLEGPGGGHPPGWTVGQEGGGPG